MPTGWIDFELISGRSDIEDVLTELESWGRGVVSRTIRWPESERRPLWKRIDEDAHFWVGRRGGKIVGFYALTFDAMGRPFLHFWRDDAVVGPMSTVILGAMVVEYLRRHYGEIFAAPTQNPKAAKLCRMLGGEEIKPRLFRWEAIDG